MEENSYSRYPPKQPKRELTEKSSTITKMLTALSSLLGLVRANKGFNSLKIFGYCFAAILVVNTYESQEKISSAQADAAVNKLFFLSGAAVVMEQYMAVVEARQRQKKK